MKLSEFRETIRILMEGENSDFDPEIKIEGNVAITFLDWEMDSSRTWRIVIHPDKHEY